MTEEADERQAIIKRPWQRTRLSPQMTGAAWGCPAVPHGVGSPAAGASAPRTPSRHTAALPSPLLGGRPCPGAAGGAAPGAPSPARPAGSGLAGSGRGGNRTLPRTVRSSQRAAPAGRAACGPCGPRCRPRGVSARCETWLAAGPLGGSVAVAASQASRAARRASRWAASSGACLSTHTWLVRSAVRGALTLPPARTACSPAVTA